MVDQQLIDYLKERTKGKLLMSPEQLAEEIGIPSKQQSKLRKEGRFPHTLQEHWKAGLLLHL